MTPSAIFGVFWWCRLEHLETQLICLQQLTRTRPAGLEPATYGLEINLWSRKWLVSKGLYHSFDQKRQAQVVDKSITSGNQLSIHCSLTNFWTNSLSPNFQGYHSVPWSSQASQILQPMDCFIPADFDHLIVPKSGHADQIY